MNHNRERLAWAVLLTSFALCVGLAVGVPLGVRHLVRTVSVAQKVSLEPQQGTLRMQRRGQGQVIALVGPTWDVPAGTVVTTDSTAEGLLTLWTPGPEPRTLAWVKIYNDTELTLLSARSPRFGVSPLPHRVVLKVHSSATPNEGSEAAQALQAEGRVRISVAPAEERSTIVEVHTPYFSARLLEGSYEVRVREGQSELSVIEGIAQVAPAEGEPLTLGNSQRVVVRPEAEGLSVEVLPGERNLLENGDFRQPLEIGWTVYHKDVQRDPAGTVERAEFAGRTMVKFHRNGVGHVEVGIRQPINYDVRDFTSLVLRLSVRVVEQSLPGCGQAGSECPIIVRIDYKDIYGTDRVWFHGFFSADPGEKDYLYPWDQQIPFRTWHAFESGNLIDPENPIGGFEAPPALIKEVTIYASGHSFEAWVTEVELLAQE